MKKTILGFIKKEILQAVRDPKMKVLLFGAPIIQMAIFGLALNNEVKNIRFAAFYKQNDVVAEKVVQKIIASGWFAPVKIAHPNEQDYYELIRSGKAEVVLIPTPAGLTHDLENNDGKIQLIIDGTNLLRGRNIENYVKRILNIQVAEYYGAQFQAPINFETKILYNPTMKTSFFLVPGVMCTVICLVTIMLTSMSIVKEKESGTFETLISSPVRTIEILLGKTIPYFILGCLNVPLIIGVALLGFGVPMRGSYLILSMASIFFVITTVSIGTLISTICRTQQQAMMAGLLFLFPAILLSGLMFPLDNMPWALKWMCYLDPLMYFIIIIRNILLKGGDLILISQNLAYLFALAMGSMGYAYYRFHKVIT